MKLKLAILLYMLLPLQLLAQGVSAQYSVAETIPGDNVLRYYRLAIPVTKTAFERNFNSDYNAVLGFWDECEEYVNRIFVPVGFCFDVVVDENLVMRERNLIDDSFYNAPSFGTELLNDVIGSAAYDIAMWVTYRPVDSENTGLSVQYGAYSHSTKGSGYAMPDSWVVAHEIGHLLGADHTLPGEGSLMDNLGDYLSLPSITMIREACMARNSAYYSDENRTQLVGGNVGGNYVYGVKVTNSAPCFDANAMKQLYRIPQGSCLAVELCATDAEGDALRYMSIGDDIYSFASLPPQESRVIDYRPRYSADIFYPEYFYTVTGTDVPMLYPGKYGITFLVYDAPADHSFEAMKAKPFYCNYAVWNAQIEVVGGTGFTASLSPAREAYTACERVTVEWGVNTAYFGADSRVRITMSSNYGRTFDYQLEASVSARDGRCVVELPNVNVGNVDVDFITAVRSMPGGVVRVEEVGGVAYTLTALSPELGASFIVTGATGICEVKGEDVEVKTIYDLQGRKVDTPSDGIYIVGGKRVVVR